MSAASESIIQNKIPAGANWSRRDLIAEIISWTFPQLLPAKILRAFSESPILRPAEKMEKEEVFRFEDGVAFELTAPVTIALLQSAEAPSGGVDRGGDRCLL